MLSVARRLANFASLVCSCTCARHPHADFVCFRPVVPLLIGNVVSVSKRLSRPPAARRCGRSRLARKKSRRSSYRKGRGRARVTTFLRRGLTPVTFVSIAVNPAKPIILCRVTAAGRRSLLPTGFGAMLRNVFPPVFPAPLISRLLSVGSCERYSFPSMHLSWRYYKQIIRGLSITNRCHFPKSLLYYET